MKRKNETMSWCFCNYSSWLDWIRAKFNFEAEILSTKEFVSSNLIIDGPNSISLKLIGFLQQHFNWDTIKSSLLNSSSGPFLKGQTIGFYSCSTKRGGQTITNKLSVKMRAGVFRVMLYAITWVTPCNSVPVTNIFKLRGNRIMDISVKSICEIYPCRF